MKSHDCCVSIASIWELSIKIGLGKLKLPRTLQEVAAECDSMGIDIVGISVNDCECLQTLPWIHRDPFDRMIIAHAISEDMTLVTHDANIHRYDGVKVLW